MSDSETLIKVDNVGKKFCRDLKRSLWYGAKDVGKELLGRAHGTNGHLRRDEFWAVQDINFEVKRGECMGLIGRNGAGKSTLLKMLNGLLKPDTGRIEMHGRVNALIELGAGFNPILTGRENIHIAGSLRGFSNAEIRRKFDDIVDFAEIGEFIDHPITHYSSGMQARLAFATCIFLDPDLLLVDEALSVGDRSFKNKCQLKVAELKARGVAMLFVSHSMGQIQQFCERVLWLHKGEVMGYGQTKQIVEQYIQWIDEQFVEKQKRRRADRKQARKRNAAAASDTGTDPLHGELHHLPEAIDVPTCRINGVEDDLAVVTPHDPMTIEYAFHLQQPIHDATIVFRIHRHDGLVLARLCSQDDGNHELGTIGPGRVEGRMELADVNLAPGQYVLLAEIVTGGRAFVFRGILGEFHVRQVTGYFNGLIGMRRTHTIRVEPADANTANASAADAHHQANATPNLSAEPDFGQAPGCVEAR